MTTAAAPLWSRIAADSLLDTRLCPVCRSSAFAEGRCRRCGADCSGPEGAALWDASQAAAAALQHRQEVLERIPRGTAAARGAAAPAGPTAETPPSAPGPAPGTAPGTAAEGRPPGPPTATVAAPASAPRSSATVQSVLAVAGAGLVAIAAVVFTFLNPDLTDRTVRSLIVAAVTVVFLLGARALARRRLRFSAEAVGALGLVFVGLDVQSLSLLAPAVSPWVLAAAGMLLAGAGMLILAVRIRLRTWLWASLTALALVPATAGAAFGDLWPSVGWAASAAAAFGLLALADARIVPSWGALRAERGTLTVVEFAAVAVAGMSALALTLDAPRTQWLAVAVLLAALAALALVSTRHPARGLWSVVAGGAGTAAFLALVPFAGEWVPTAWQIALAPALAVTGHLLWAGLLRPPRTVARPLLAGGSLVSVGVSLLPAGLAAVGTVALGLIPSAWSTWTAEAAAFAFAPVVGLAAAGAGLIAFAALPGRPLRWVGDAGVWLVAGAGLVLASAAVLDPGVRVAIGLTLVLAVALLVRTPALRRLGIRLPLVLAAHAAVVLAVTHSWQAPSLVVPAGAAIVAAVGVLATTVPAPKRFLYVGAGYAYALVVLATGLDRAGLDAIPALCLTTSAGAVTAVVVTFVRRVGAREWYAVLVVTAAPFVLGVAQVLQERSGWTALSTGLIFVLALTLLTTRRPGLNTVVRALAAALLVPSLAVVVVCLGAQLLDTSGSPVVLPVIAVIAAIVLGTASATEAALVPRIGPKDAAFARIALEASTLLTAAIAVALSLAREAAGLGTATLVLVILGVGAAASALWAGRRYGWPLAGALFTGALWCVWGLAGVTAPEPYLLPPALGTALVGLVLTLSGRRGLALYGSGLAVALVPLLAVLAWQGSALRGILLVGAAWALLLVAGVLRRARRAAHLREITLSAAMVASGAAIPLSVRFALGLDEPGMPLLAACLLAGLAGAAAAALAARSLLATAAPEGRLARSRWLYAPAVTVFTAFAWCGIHRDWMSIWTLWALMLVLLAGMVAVSAVQRRRATTLPPALFLFALTFVTAVVAWSPRDLRVEWFSLPLGVFLLAAGALHLGRTAPGRRSPASWPAGFAGSWALLGPGLAVAFSASMAATFTDPQTWRAILVIVLALLAILVGARAKLAAPFLIGVVVLPIENVLAFLVQIGRGIESMPWWITLAVVGAVLLILAVTYERREGADAGIAARLRDLG